MAYKKDLYKQLKELGGFSPKEANIWARKPMAKAKAVLEDRILLNLETGAKYTRKEKAALARFFGFKGSVLDRIKGFSNVNLLETLKTKAIPEVGDLALKRAKDDIAYKKALEYSLLFNDAGEFERVYVYKVEFTVTSDIRYFQDKYYVTVVSPDKKLTKREVFKDVLENIFPRHEEEYLVVADPTSLKIVDAYYMTREDYNKLVARRKHERANTPYSNKGKK